MARLRYYKTYFLSKDTLVTLPVKNMQNKTCQFQYEIEIWKKSVKLNTVYRGRGSLPPNKPERSSIMPLPSIKVWDLSPLRRRAARVRACSYGAEAGFSLNDQPRLPPSSLFRVWQIQKLVFKCT